MRGTNITYLALFPELALRKGFPLRRLLNDHGHVVLLFILRVLLFGIMIAGHDGIGNLRRMLNSSTGKVANRFHLHQLPACDGLCVARDYHHFKFRKMRIENKNNVNFNGIGAYNNAASGN